MTREEAIARIKEHMIIHKNKEPRAIYITEALDMAIQALEKENIYDDKEHYVTISKALYDKLNIDYEALSQEPCDECLHNHTSICGNCNDYDEFEQEPCDDAISRILKRMWNCRGKHTTSIDKVKMEQIIRDEITSVNPQPCEDAVSKQEILNIIDDMAKEYYTNKDFDKAQGIAWVKLQRLPSVNPQKIGHWIITPFSVTGRHYQCSECKYIHTFTNFEYCPKCGARMVEPQESEENK